MVDSTTDFFQVFNNFSRIEKIRSVRIIRPKLSAPARVSIVIPTHRRPDLLKAVIESALNQQGYPDFEVIVVDDDPTRGCKTEELLKTFADDRLSYYKNTENLGMISNWNRCFELATGKWVVMLHDDDLLLNFFLKDCMALVDQQPHIGIIKPKWYHWADDGHELTLPEIEGTNNLNRVYEISQLMGDRIGAPTGILINKEKFIAIGGFNPDYFPSSDKCFITLFAYYFEVYQFDKVASVYRWLRNDSLKVDILAGFLNNDYYLFKYLCRRFVFPGVLANNFLNFKFRNIVGYYKTINRDFTFDKSSLGLKNVKKIIGKPAYILAKRIVALYSKFYITSSGKSVFKRRQSRLVRLTLPSPPIGTLRAKERVL